MATPRRRPRAADRRPLWSARGGAVWALLAGLLLAPCAAQGERRAEVAAVLAQLPGGPREAQAAWLFQRAREASDARVAFDLQNEVIRRFPGATAVQARLWKTRFFMAAGDTSAARRELDAVRDLKAAGPEAGYWGVVLGRAQDAGAGAATGTLPPWDLMRGIAALGRGPSGSRGVRAALELEGAARRWGLLGPWLWRLARSSNAALRTAASEILAAPRGALAAAPETAALRARVAIGRERPEAPAAAPPGADSSGVPPAERGLAVQVGTFEEPDPARELLRELVGYGFDAYLQTLPAADGGALHHVRVGRGCSRAAAESLGAALSQRLMLSYEIVDAASTPPESLGSEPR